MLPASMRSLLVLAVLLIGALSARAQLIFTVTGNAVSTAGGYNTGQAYSFVFTTFASFPNNGSSNFVAQESDWLEETTTTDSQLYASITGSGVLGSYTRPTSLPADPSSYLITSNYPQLLLQLKAAADFNPDIGLTTPNATAIRWIDASMDIGVAFSETGTYVEPATYFVSNGYLGNFSPTSGLIVLRDSLTNPIDTFTITGLTITAVPEPATFAALLGAGVLGLAVLRRRGRRVG